MSQSPAAVKEVMQMKVLSRSQIPSLTFEESNQNKRIITPCIYRHRKIAHQISTQNGPEILPDKVLELNHKSYDCT
jgi:hypothetical protein